MYIHLQPFDCTLSNHRFFVWRLDQAFLFAPPKKKVNNVQTNGPMESRRIFWICTLILECCFVAHLLLWLLLRCRRSSPEPQPSALAQVASRIRQLRGWLWQWSKNQATWGWTLRFIFHWYCLGWHHSLANDTPVQSMNGKEVWEVLRKIMLRKRSLNPYCWERVPVFWCYERIVSAKCQSEDEGHAARCLKFKVHFQGSSSSGILQSFLCVDLASYSPVKVVYTYIWYRVCDCVYVM